MIAAGRERNWVVRRDTLSVFDSSGLCNENDRLPLNSGDPVPPFPLLVRIMKYEVSFYSDNRAKGDRYFESETG